MPDRSLSATFLQALFAGRTSEAYWTLVVVSGGGMTTKRYVNYQDDVWSNGVRYVAAAFDARPPDDIEDQIPDVNTVFDNVDRTMIADIRSATSAPDVDISIILKSDPDTIEVGPWSLKVRSVDYTRLTISGKLKYEDILNELAPKKLFTVQNNPGLFP